MTLHKRYAASFAPAMVRPKTSSGVLSSSECPFAPGEGTNVNPQQSHQKIVKVGQRWKKESASASWKCHF